MNATFESELHHWSWDEVHDAISKKTQADVEAAISRAGSASMDDFMA